MKYSSDLRTDAVGVDRASVARLGWHANQVVVRITECRDFGTDEPSLVDRCANRVGARRIRELQLNDRTARELDTVIQRVASSLLMVEHEGEAKHDERGRSDRGLLPVLDDVVLGVVKYAQPWH